ncbi:MAG: 4'-phosphopantetheinyl transferase superfamily protein [Lachnospiraceae bacterium]|nr:4'-phosphopantetheinyl transferase superfamily protein [Lachnospiraceae bacterium]
MVRIEIQNLNQLNIEEIDVGSWVGAECRKKMKRLKREKDKKAAFAGEYLFSKGILFLKEADALPKQLFTQEEEIPPVPYERNQYGAPYLPGGGLYFNWSHSGDYAACVIADCPVGIDIQKKQKFRLAVAKRYYPERIVKGLSSLPGDEQEKLFFRYWTLWEACLKARGTGFYENVRPLPLYSENLPDCGKIYVKEKEIWHYHFLSSIEEYDIPGYECCLVSREKTGEEVFIL